LKIRNGWIILQVEIIKNIIKKCIMLKVIH
jgi:hypothetical protein